MSRDFEIRKEVELDATPERVWEAITTREGLRAWLFDQEFVPDATSAQVWDRPHRLLVRLPRAPDGATQAFEYVIEARAGGHAVLRFVHSGFLGDSWDADFDFSEVTGYGWTLYLHTLAEYFAHFAGRPAMYVEIEAPPASSAEGAWPRLMAQIGVAEGLEAGDAVRFEPEGMAPIEGVADFVTPGHFLGIRTSDSLIRFHSRGGLAMPVAVGMHLYDGPSDPDRIRTAWHEWLTAVYA